MILSGQLYASAALIGATVYTVLFPLDLPEGFAEFIAFSSTLTLRAAAIRYDIRMGERGSFIRIGKGDV